MLPIGVPALLATWIEGTDVISSRSMGDASAALMGAKIKTVASVKILDLMVSPLWFASVLMGLESQTLKPHYHQCAQGRQPSA